MWGLNKRADDSWKGTCHMSAEIKGIIYQVQSPLKFHLCKGYLLFIMFYGWLGIGALGKPLKKKIVMHCFFHRNALEKDYITMKNYYNRNKVSEIPKEKLYYSNI